MTKAESEGLLSHTPKGVGAPEIEITPAMTQAGADVIGTGDLELVTPHQLADQVYRAMEMARRAEDRLSPEQLGPVLR